MDYTAIGGSIAAILTAVGAVYTGFYQGKKNVKIDEAKAKAELSKSELAREIAEDESAIRLMQLASKDSEESRRKLRELEDEFSSRMSDARYDGQRGWNLGQYHYNLLVTVAHILDTILLMDALGRPFEEISAAIKNAAIRMKSIKIPATMEEPYPDMRPRGKKLGDMS